MLQKMNFVVDFADVLQWAWFWGAAPFVMGDVVVKSHGA